MADEGFKRKLTAILSADAVGYSRLMREDEESTVRDIAAHRILISEIIQQHHGRVIDSPGDNLLAEFASVVDAVNGAIIIQKEIKRSNTDTAKDRRMEFRIGINLGDVIEEKDRIYGDGVNIAARVEGLAAAGGILISGTVYEHVKDKLSLGYHYLGEQDVKNIPEPVQVYRLLTEFADAGKMIGEEKTKSSRFRYAAFSALALIILVVGALVIWDNYFRVQIEPASVDKMASPLPEKPSIAVLPFDNLSNDPEQKYFSDGMTDDIITDLSKIKALLVISRNSTFTYKGQDKTIPVIAQELNVRYVLEGSVRKSGDQVRINAQLIDAKTDHHVWADRFDGKVENIFDLQDKITSELVTALKIKFDVGGIDNSKKKETHDVRAYEYFLKGWNHYLLTTENDFKKAIDLYQKALEVDPEYSRVYAALALVYKDATNLGTSGSWLDSMAGSGQVNKSLVLAEKYLHKAMKDPTSISYAVSSAILLYDKRQYKEAITQAEEGISYDPNSLPPRFALVRALIMSGRSAEALSQIEEILWLDPINPARAYVEFGLAYFCLGDLDTAYNYIEKAKSHNPKIGCEERAVVYAYKGLIGAASVAALECKTLLNPLTIDHIRLRMKSFPFKDKNIAQKFAKGLYLAKVPGNASGYYKVYDEYRMSESEIKNLLTNKKIQVFVGETIWSLEFTDNNVCIYKGVQSTEKGKYWFEKDSIWLDLPQRFYGENCQANVYKNPDGSWEVGNLYIFVSSFGIFPFSHEE